MVERFFQDVLSKYASVNLKSSASVAGGCINHTAKLTTDQGPLFIKWNSAQYQDLFNQEAKGLSILEEHSKLVTPGVLEKGVIDTKAYLLLEWIEPGHSSNQFWEDFGFGLAELHKCSSDQFGLDHDNYIGRLPQSNQMHKNWVDFFVDERLVPQLKLASSKQLVSAKILSDFESLFIKLGDLIPIENPAFIHGDLWSGNYLVDFNSKPVLIDPAVHYGHRETELAFTHLFGGFDNQFYDSYNEAYPLEGGFQDRIDIHNLYPLLVHVNLFGSTYLSGITQTLRRFT